MVGFVAASTDDAWTSAADSSLDVEAFSTPRFLGERRVFPQLDPCLL